MKPVLCLLVWFSLMGCAQTQPLATSPGKAATSGHDYLVALAAQSRRADRIIVTEHSYESDAFDRASGKSLVPDQIVYDSRTLDALQQAEFADAVASLDPTVPNFQFGCFEPHHSLHFYERGVLAGTMEVCFLCSSVRWDRTQEQEPAALLPELARLVRSIGLTPHRDWHALAQEHARSRR
jgi:hypothetical protein